MGLTPYKLARRIGVPVGRITGIIHGKRAITADTALRLGKAFSTSAQMWLNLQAHYEIDMLDEQRDQIVASIIPFPTPGPGGDDRGGAQAA